MRFLPEQNKIGQINYIGKLDPRLLKEVGDLKVIVLSKNAIVFFN
jgi:hypothetical protein